MRKDRIIKKCLLCGKEFETIKSRKEQKYCCLECYHLAAKTELNVLRKRKKIKCNNCGKIFECFNYEKRKFCSIKCGSIFQQKNTPKIETKIIKKCLNCGKEIKIHKYRKNSAKFCSQKCFNDYRRGTIICKTCNKKFKAPNYEKRKFCSQKCSIKGCEKRKSVFSQAIINYIKTFCDIETESLVQTKNFKYWVDIKIKNKIIECYGDYWHCNPKKYNEDYYHAKIRQKAKDIWKHDNKRINNIKTLNHDVLIIWEYDWNHNNKNTIKKIQNFLKNEIRENNKN